MSQYSSCYKSVGRVEQGSDTISFKKFNSDRACATTAGSRKRLAKFAKRAVLPTSSHRCTKFINRYSTVKWTRGTEKAGKMMDTFGIIPSVFAYCIAHDRSDAMQF
jgi:hypothetical protein